MSGCSNKKAAQTICHLQIAYTLISNSTFFFLRYTFTFNTINLIGLLKVVFDQCLCLQVFLCGLSGYISGSRSGQQRPWSGPMALLHVSASTAVRRVKETPWLEPETTRVLRQWQWTGVCESHITFIQREILCLQNCRFLVIYYVNFIVFQESTRFILQSKQSRDVQSESSHCLMALLQVNMISLWIL